jgi:hypothetical protein
LKNTDAFESLGYSKEEAEELLDFIDRILNEEVSVSNSTGNVFKDLGLPEADKLYNNVPEAKEIKKSMLKKGQAVRNLEELYEAPQITVVKGSVGLVTDIDRESVEVTFWSTRGLRSFWLSSDAVELVQ